MKRHVLVATLSLLVIAVSSIAYSAQPGSAKPAAKVAVSPLPVGDEKAAAKQAWELFIQAMSPVSGPGGPLNFENWNNQCQFETIGCSTIGMAADTKTAARRLHGSALRAAMTSTIGIPNIGCNFMNTSGPKQYNPSNLAPLAQFCEEVFVNDAEKAFVTENSLTTLIGQQNYADAHGGAIAFPWQAVEIKADWVPQASYTNSFSCPDKTGKLYTETIDGVCYALAGLHIASKVLPNWLWATFEPNSTITNPNRCDPTLYDSCFDPYGTTSSTPYAKGQPVPPQSAQLKQAMNAAGLNKAFNNYYLTGVETDFLSNGKPRPLGNSFVEFNAGVQPGTASCITCHRYAYFDGAQPNPPGSPEDNFGFPPIGWSSVGNACSQNPHVNCTPVVPHSISQDFSWMLGLMPYN